MADENARGGEGYTVPSEYYSENSLHGNYQFINLTDVINNFTATYVGEGKILANVLGGDVNYHAHRAIQELSYDLFKSHKTQEINVPPSLQMILPHDYVNYTKITWSDANGIEHIIYPTSKTSNANTIQQNDDGEYLFTANWKRIDQEDVETASLELFQDHITAWITQHNDDGGVDTVQANSTGPFNIYTYEQGYTGNDAISYPSGGGAGMGTNTFPTTNDGKVDYDNADSSPLKVGMELKSKYFPTGTTVATIEHVANDGEIAYTKFTTSKASLNDLDIPVYIGETFAANEEGLHVTFIDNTSSTTWGKYKGASGTSVGVTNTLDPGTDNSNYFTNTGERYGLNPQFAQANGSYFIDQVTGKIHFSSALSGKTIILHYLSDSVGDSEETLVHKLAEEAVYKWILYACASARIDIPENIIQRLKRERSAEVRKAKLRLSNIKLEELTQILRGKSKWIKH